MIAYSTQRIEKDDIKAVTKALKGKFLTGGERVRAFEEAICKYIGVKYAVVFNSATSALHVAYLSARVKKDDEVITSPLTFAATSTAALMCGANVRFCDIKKNGNIDATKIENLINKKTKVITPVDFGGYPVEMDEILKVAKKHKLCVIDDASHAFGSRYSDGSFVGSKAHISIFSFHAIKPITTFEGGALVTNDENIYKKAKLLRSHNITKTSLWDSELESVGYNYRLSDVACALGLSQIKKVDRFIQKRQKIATRYEKAFDANPYFKTIHIPDSIKSSRHLYPILLNRSLQKRKEMIFADLHKKGVGVQVHYKPLYEYKLFKDHPSLLSVERFYKSELSIPLHQNMSKKDEKYVIKTLFEVLKKHA